MNKTYVLGGRQREATTSSGVKAAPPPWHRVKSVQFSEGGGFIQRPHFCFVYKSCENKTLPCDVCVNLTSVFFSKDRTGSATWATHIFHQLVPCLFHQYSSVTHQISSKSYKTVVSTAANVVLPQQWDRSNIECPFWMQKQSHIFTY